MSFWTIFWLVYVVIALGTWRYVAQGFYWLPDNPSNYNQIKTQGKLWKSYGAALVWGAMWFLFWGFVFTKLVADWNKNRKKSGRKMPEWLRTLLVGKKVPF